MPDYLVHVHHKNPSREQAGFLPVHDQGWVTERVVTDGVELSPYLSDACVFTMQQAMKIIRDHEVPGVTITMLAVIYP